MNHTNIKQFGIDSKDEYTTTKKKVWTAENNYGKNFENQCLICVIDKKN